MVVDDTNRNHGQVRQTTLTGTGMTSRPVIGGSPYELVNEVNMAQPLVNCSSPLEDDSSPG